MRLFGIRRSVHANGHEQEFQSLYGDTRTTQFLFDLLELVRLRLLRMRPDKRASCSDIVTHLKEIHGRCERDFYSSTGYCTDPKKLELLMPPTELSELSYRSSSSPQPSGSRRNSTARPSRPSSPELPRPWTSGHPGPPSPTALSPVKEQKEVLDPQQNPEPETAQERNPVTNQQPETKPTTSDEPSFTSEITQTINTVNQETSRPPTPKQQTTPKPQPVADHSPTADTVQHSETQTTPRLASLQTYSPAQAPDDIVALEQPQERQPEVSSQPPMVPSETVEEIVQDGNPLQPDNLGPLLVEKRGRQARLWKRIKSGVRKLRWG
jgi:hypothetical protein